MAEQMGLTQRITGALTEGACSWITPRKAVRAHSWASRTPRQANKLRCLPGRSRSIRLG